MVQPKNRSGEGFVHHWYMARQVRQQGRREIAKREKIGRQEPSSPIFHAPGRIVQVKQVLQAGYVLISRGP
jgi:hypothetical protein